MEEAEGPESTVELLTTRIMLLNFAAIHVGPDIISSHTCDAEIFNLAVRHRTLRIDIAALTLT